MWNDKNRSFDDNTMGKEFQDELDKLLYIKPKPKGRGGNEERELEYLRDLMRQSGKRKKRGGSRKPNDRRWRVFFFGLGNRL